MPLINNNGCLDSYLFFICKINFRSCNNQSKFFNSNKADTTSDMCSSVCNDFVSNCATNTMLCTKLSTTVYSSNQNCFN